MILNAMVLGRCFKYTGSPAADFRTLLSGFCLMPTSDSLPGPHSRPAADLVIYDGHCQFCRAQVERLARLDAFGKWVGGSERLSYISLHDPLVGERFPDLTHEMLMEQMYVIDARGGRHGGADAVRYLSRRLRVLWPLAPILHLPLSAYLWRWSYAQVARQRYRWNKQDCESGSCELHFGEKKESSLQIRQQRHAEHSTHRE